MLQKPTKILVVDDDRSIRNMLNIVLKRNGYGVTTEDSAESALNRLKNEFFDLIISDIKMPGISGIELLRKIKTLQPEVPVIMITAFASMSPEGVFRMCFSSPGSSPVTSVFSLISTPKDFACSTKALESSSPEAGFEPGQFSTRYVVAICPPRRPFSSTAALSPERAAYIPAVRPPGPAPIIAMSYMLFT